VLERTGFRRIGKIYSGRNRSYIQLFVRTKRGDVQKKEGFTGDNST